MSQESPSFQFSTLSCVKWNFITITAFPQELPLARTTTICQERTVSVGQVCAIIYASDTSSFDISSIRVKWWKVAVILECFEVTAVIISALSLEIPNFLELAWITPLTSQAVAVVAILQASRHAPAKGKVRDLAGFLLVIGLMLAVFSLVFLVLSLTGWFPRLMYSLSTLYMLSLAVIYHPKIEPESALTRRPHRRWFKAKPSRDDSCPLVPLGRPHNEGLYLPKTYMPST